MIELNILTENEIMRLTHLSTLELTRSESTEYEDCNKLLIVLFFNAVAVELSACSFSGICLQTSY